MWSLQNSVSAPHNVLLNRNRFYHFVFNWLWCCNKKHKMSLELFSSVLIYLYQILKRCLLLYRIPGWPPGIAEYLTLYLHCNDVSFMLWEWEQQVERDPFKKFFCDKHIHGEQNSKCWKWASTSLMLCKRSGKGSNIRYSTKKLKVFCCIL